VTTGSTAATPEERVLNTVSCDDVTESMEIVCEAYDLIQTHYVDDVADTTLAEAAGRALEGLDGPDTLEPITCALPADSFEEPCGIAAEMANDEREAAEIMVAGMATFALDANSAYFDEEALANLVEEQGGEIEGIGALVSPEDRTLDEEDQQCSFITVTCRIYIVSTIKDTPAEAAGLQRDDVIVGVNGESVIGWTIDEVTAQVRGPAGTEVLLTMERAGEIFDVSIVRAAVVIPVIESEQIGETGYVQLRVFSDNADEQFAEAVTDLLAQGIDELVVDLRDNPGGLLTTAIEITSAFVADGDVGVTQSPDDSTTYPVTGAVIVPADVNVVFVVNKGSASASEVISATLQERGRVTVVGENTFGKNTVQQRFALSNGGALKLTIARWLTPGGLDFGGLGVTPDIPLDLEIGLDPAALVEAVHAAA
jgi:carboxyl-terminal processing protease